VSTCGGFREWMSFRWPDKSGSDGINLANRHKIVNLWLRLKSPRRWDSGVCVKRNEICTVYKAYGGSLGEPNMADHIVKDSPRQEGRIADTFYPVTLLTGLPAFFLRSNLRVALGPSCGVRDGTRYRGFSSEVAHPCAGIFRILFSPGGRSDLAVHSVKSNEDEMGRWTS
jgi:hypothetical protein